MRKIIKSCNLNSRQSETICKLNLKYLYTVILIAAFAFLIDFNQSKLSVLPENTRLNSYAKSNNDKAKESTKTKEPKFRKDRIIVVLKDENKLNDLIDKASIANKKIVKSSDSLNKSKKRNTQNKGKKFQLENAVILKLNKEFTSDEILEAVRTIKKNDYVKYAEPDYDISLSALPDDTYYSDQWALKQINAEKAWDKVTDASNVVIAHIDTGLNYKHEDLIDSIWVNWGELNKYIDKIIDVNNNQLVDCQDLFDSKNSFVKDSNDDDENGYTDDYCGWDFESNDNNPFDEESHGSHTAGILGAKGNNKIGISGTSWKSKILPLKVFGPTASGSLSSALNAIKYASDMGAKILTNSWGITVNSQSLFDAVRYAHERNIVVIGAAGNNNADTLTFNPSGLADSITTTALDKSNNLAYFSNYGLKQDIAAPGFDIKSTIFENNYGNKSGTSMAAPHVAGAVMLLLSYKPTLNPEQVRQVLRKSAKDIGQNGKDELFGYGKLDLGNMLEFADSHSDIPAPYVSYPVNNEDFTNNVDQDFEVKGQFYGAGFKSYKLFLNNGLGYKEITSSNDNYTDVLGKIRISDLSDETSSSIKVVVNANDSENYEFEVLGLIKNKLSIDLDMPLYISKGKVDVIGKIILNGEETLSKYQVMYKKTSDPDSLYSSSGISLTDTTNGVVAKWDASGLSVDQKYTVRLSASTSGGISESIKKDVIISKDMVAGWPKYARSELRDGEYFGYVPALGDINNDGTREIIYVDKDRVIAYNKNGSLVSGFPYIIDNQNEPFPPYVFNRSPLVADLNNDGKKEIIAVANKANNYKIKLIVLDGTGKLMSGWPKEYNFDSKIYSDNSPIAIDQNNDGQKDLIFYTVSDGKNILQVLNASGSSLPGFPKPIASYVDWHSSITASDIDYDGKLELAMVDGGTKLYLYDLSGNLKSGYPASISDGSVLNASVVFANTSGDIRKELLVLSTPKNCFYPCTKTLNGFDYKGAKMTFASRNTWQSNMPSNMDNIVTGDMDATGFDEFSFDELLPGTIYMDIGNDLKLEKFLIDQADNSIAIVDKAGNKYWKAPGLITFNYSNDRDRYWSPSVSDIDNNGKYDLSIKAGSFLYLFEIPGVSGKLEYPQYMHDEIKSGNANLQTSLPQVPNNPLVQITSPLNGATLTGLNKVVVTAVSNVKIKNVILQASVSIPTFPNALFSDKVWYLTSATNTYSVDIDFTSLFSPGTTLYLSAYAIDINGNVSSKASVLTVKTNSFIPVFINFEKPFSNQSISSGAITVSGKVGGTKTIKSVVGRRCLGPSYSQCSNYIPVSLDGKAFSYVDKFPIWKGQWQYQGIVTDVDGKKASASVVFYYGMPSPITIQ